MLTCLEHRTAVPSIPQASGSLPPWVPSDIGCTLAFGPDDDSNGDVVIQMQLSPLPITPLMIMDQPQLGSQCSICGQMTVCPTCHQCHYCNDIDLPCASMYHGNRVLIATQIDRIMSIRDVRPLVSVAPRNDYEATVLERIIANLDSSPLAIKEVKEVAYV